MAPVAESPRLYLEPFTPQTCEAYLPAFHEIWSNPDSMLWSTKAPRKNMQESRELLTAVSQDSADMPVEKFFIILREDGGTGQMIGHLGTNKPSEQGMEVGYCINIKHWGKGYATEALRLFLDFYWGLPERKNVDKLVAKIHKDNAASRKVLIKVGAREGEVIKETYPRFVDGGKLSDDYCWYLDRPGDK